MKTDLQRYRAGDRDQAAKTAWADYLRGRRTPKPRVLVPCGTVSAYTRHLRRGEEPCDACRAAVAEKNRKAQRARRASSRGTG